MDTVRSHSSPSALHLGIDDVPWVRDTRLNTESRIVQVRDSDGLYVTHARFPAGFAVGTHRHTGPVLAFTTTGAWGYRENHFVNRAGSYLYEPQGSVHTLFTPDDNIETTEAIFAIYGEVHYLDPSGNVIDVSDGRRALARYYAACEEAGLPRPDRILR